MLIIYRYLGASHALDALQKRSWKVGRLRELNDPLDCAPRLTNVLGIVAKSTGTRKFHPHFLERFSERVGLLCYSGQVRDPVIWSHYAESHRGIALGFDASAASPETLYKVKYSKKRGALDVAAVHGVPVTGTPKLSVMDGFTVKAPSWSYEDEYRTLIDLNTAEMIGENYFVPLPARSLVQVVLGVRCIYSNNDIRRILKSWPNAEKIEVLRAKMSRNSYQLEIGKDKIRISIPSEFQVPTTHPEA